MRTYRLTDLGCKVNQYETQLLAERLEAAGLVPAEHEEPADVCIVNTCAVTATAAAKSARAVRQLRRRNPGALVVAAGCAVTAAGREEILRRTGADLAWTQDAKLDLPGLALKHAAPAPLTITRFDAHCRAFLKVQDGCDARCAYCIVPSLRGPSRSRPAAEVCREAACLDASGHRELVLSGIHMGLWGRDLPRQPGLASLVTKVLAAAPGCRVRLSSLDPSELAPELLDLMAAEERLCPHLHLPLQSGDDEVLAAMRRRYNSAGFLAAVELAAAKLSRPAITTDVMVGFPGEDRDAFRRTIDVCRRAALSRLHVFPYSPRRGTDAAGFPGRCSTAELRSRADELIAVGAELSASFAAGLAGTDEEVLAEERLSGDLVAGYSRRYVRVRFPCPAPRLRRLYRVRLLEALGGEMRGEATTG
jgi:threonylcarbamoyladenosine tRNA methylthiotransferase MtaB